MMTMMITIIMNDVNDATYNDEDDDNKRFHVSILFEMEEILIISTINY